MYDVLIDPDPPQTHLARKVEAMNKHDHSMIERKHTIAMEKQRENNNTKYIKKKKKFAPR